ncbi:hypothetical protein RMCBS344292_18110 [Rhizopus microsporus]|nr:hypothetical protein RMCBS344292_18110 [Rhizopus microsporus]
MEYGHRTTIHQMMGDFLHQEFISPLYLVWGNDFLVNSAYNPLIAPNSRHVILYGGQNDNGVVSDYLYTLNLDNNTWTHVNLSATGQILTRAYHSGTIT